VFLEIALPMAKRGVRQVPSLNARDRFPGPKNWPAIATTDEATLTHWGNNDYVNHNSCSVADENVAILDIDDYEAAKAIGMPIPKTLAVKTPSGGFHLYLKQTERSRAFGNRAMPKVVELKSRSAAVAAPGCVRDDKPGTYEIVKDRDIVDFPDTLCDWIEENIPRATKKDATPVREDFDIDDWMGHYGLSYVQNGDWYITDVCPLAGVKHSGSKYTGFYFDGNRLGFKCFSDDCSHATIGEVIRRMNEETTPYPPIWEEEPLDFAALNVDELGESEAAINEITQMDVLETTVTPEIIAELLGAMRVTDYKINKAVVPMKLQPMPESCLYGWLGEKALALDMPLGYAYPAMVTAFCGHNIHQIGTARPTLYTCLIGPVHSGKSVAADRAVKSLNYGREDAVNTTTPGSDRGLYAMFGVKKGADAEKCELLKTHLLVQDELRDTFGKISVQGSSLAPTLCKLWSTDEAGSADKTGEHTVHVRLSILGALKAKDATDFAKVFGSATNDGLYDRFVYGIIPKGWEYEEWHVVPDNRRPKGTKTPKFCYEMLREWRAEGRKVGLDRGRLGEIALRWALITASANHDNEITIEGMEKALLFCEWQENVRHTYKAGVSDLLDGQCMGAVLDAFERLEGKPVKFSDLAKKKNWYRDFHTSLGRVRQVLINDGVLVEETKIELDENGKDREKKTGRIYLPLETKADDYAATT
jgi:Bifunctional DNA primase/polymerase, N-terminal